jgi:hypothetical protein
VFVLVKEEYYGKRREYEKDVRHQMLFYHIFLPSHGGVSQQWMFIEP